MAGRDGGQRLSLSRQDVAALRVVFEGVEQKRRAVTDPQVSARHSETSCPLSRAFLSLTAATCRLVTG